ncbi:hypothetical protein LCGC14_1769540, partial [marine sediment metagenome]
MPTVEFRPAGDGSWHGFMSREYVIEVLVDGRVTAQLIAAWPNHRLAELRQLGGTDKILITGGYRESDGQEVIGPCGGGAGATGWIVLTDVEVGLFMPGAPGVPWYLDKIGEIFQGRCTYEMKNLLIVGLERNLWEMLYNLFAALSGRAMKQGYNEHIQKLDVSAGDHCLQSSEVARGDARVITSITSVASCAVDAVTLSRNYMNNVFKIKSEGSPTADETVSQEGYWIIYGGEFMQVCFENVPAGCDLHLYISGSGWQSPALMGLSPLAFLGLPPIVAEEDVFISGIWSCDFAEDKIYKHNMDVVLNAVKGYNSPAGSPSGLAWDGSRIW